MSCGPKLPPHILNADAARTIVAQVLIAYGATTVNASVVADHLVDADLAGVRSHGLLRVPQYVDEILGGEIDPAASPSVIQAGASRRDIEGHRCFGQVAGVVAIREGVAVAAQEGMALVTVRDVGHVGRIGAYAEKLGQQGFVSMLFCSGPRSGHRVSPFNGREGRLATNPLAFSVPTENDPIVGDFSSAAAPEGRIRYLRNIGEEAPPDTLLDAEGHVTTDPNALYADPPGTILAFGGTRLGHRGFALGLLVEALATLLARDETDDPSRIGNNVALVVLGVDDGFRARAQRMAAYILSSLPRDREEVILPGTLEQRRRAGSGLLEIEPSVWQRIVEYAYRRGIAVNDY